MERTTWTVIALVLTVSTVRADDPPAWVGPMKDVHAKFTGKPGTLALFGDSITVSKAFWSPLEYAKDLPAPLAKNLEAVRGHMLK